MGPGGPTDGGYNGVGHGANNSAPGMDGIGADGSSTGAGAGRGGLGAGRGGGGADGSPPPPTDGTAGSGAPPKPRLALGPNLTIDPLAAANSPDAAHAMLTRANWEDWVDRFQPVEEELISQVANLDPTQVGRDARADVEGRYAGLRGQMTRLADRAQTGATPEQANAMARRAGLQRSLDMTTAFNTSKRGATERRMQMLGQLSNLSRGLSSSAMDGLGNSASMASAREQSGKAAKSQWRNSMISTGLTAAAMMFMM